MLLDHFNGELEQYRDWHGFHQAWAIMLAADLNRRLPTGWFAEPNVQFQIEIDVAAFESQGESTAVATPGTSELQPEWSKPDPTAVLEMPLWNDIVAVEVYAPGRPRNLAGAIELVSPSNKDRPESRDSFVTKCEQYLRTGIGLVIVDVVTARHADLHGLLLERLAPEYHVTEPPGLFACAYEPVMCGDRLRLPIWLTKLKVGDVLPVLPLSLRHGPDVPVDLNATYLEACRNLRIPNPANSAPER
ncbi:DUF4058 family protein [bacterium]|nr:DUF4058 family protein [bacterium]